MKTWGVSKDTPHFIGESKYGNIRIYVYLRNVKYLLCEFYLDNKTDYITGSLVL